MPGHTKRIMLGLALLPGCVSAAVNDIFPTDFVALPSGMTNASVYLMNQNASGPYKDGRRLLNGEVTLNLVALRLAKVFAAGDQGQYAFGPVAVLSYGDFSPNPTLSSALGSAGNGGAGTGDLRLGGSFWFRADRANREFGAINFGVILPTGTYDNTQFFNTGENRMKYVLQAGWMTQLGKKWVMDIAPEIALYGDNDRYRGNRKLTQDVSYALTTYLRYRVNEKFQLMSGAVINRGGATQINGVDQGAPNNTRLSAGVMMFTGGFSHLQLRYSRDVAIDSGFRADGDFALRYTFSF